MSEQYKQLASFLQSWFHQDFDISGETLEEVVKAYRSSASSRDIEYVLSDIDKFLTNGHAGRFDELFDLDIDPLAFAPSIDEFLLAISDVLAER